MAFPAMPMKVVLAHKSSHKTRNRFEIGDSRCAGSENSGAIYVRAFGLCPR